MDINNLEEAKIYWVKLLSRLEVESKKKRRIELEAETLSEGFWSDPTRAKAVMKEISDIDSDLSIIEEINIGLELDSTEVLPLIKKMQLKATLSGKYDSKDAVLSIHAGQGGTEANDWSAMLSRMYERFAERKGLDVVLVEETLGEEAGIKTAVFEIKGPYAFGNLKGEAGVHRLVRQSPFNAQHLRQTSFALVEVIPLLDDPGVVEIKDDDLIVETYRSSGHGGQNVQKVETAVRIKHKPSGIIVSCQTQRYQAQNKSLAMQILVSKLAALKEEAARIEKARLKGGYKTPGWGNQIRSYVLHPYKMVKDLRTEYESSDPQKILDGDLDDFIEAELLFGV